MGLLSTVYNNKEPQVLSEKDDGKVILKKDNEQTKVCLEREEV